MANKFKYNATRSEANSVFKGNWAIDTSAVNTGGGPSSSTSLYHGAEIPAGGYTIYNNNAVFTAANAAQLISYTNQIAGTSFTTVAQSLDWYNTQPTRIAMNIRYPTIPTNGIAFISDVGSSLCYPLTGSTVYSIDPSSFAPAALFQNGPSYVSEYGGGIQCDGVDDLLYMNNSTGGGFGIFNTTALTWVIIARGTDSSGNWSQSGLLNNRYADSGFVMNSNTGTRGVTFYMAGNGNIGQVNIGTITPANINIPHMYVISSNGTNLHKAYVDNGSPLSSTSSVTRTAAQHEVFIGRNGYFTNSCVKMVAYVAIMYTRQLSDAEVLALYDGYKGRFGF